MSVGRHNTLSRGAAAGRRRRRRVYGQTMNECRLVGTTRCRVALLLRGGVGVGRGGREEEEGCRNARGGGFMRSGGEEIIGIHMRTEGGRPKPYSTRSAASNGGVIKGLASRG